MRVLRNAGARLLDAVRNKDQLNRAVLNGSVTQRKNIVTWRNGVSQAGLPVAGWVSTNPGGKNFIRGVLSFDGLTMLYTIEHSKRVVTEFLNTDTVTYTDKNGTVSVLNYAQFSGTYPDVAAIWYKVEGDVAIVEYDEGTFFGDLYITGIPSMTTPDLMTPVHGAFSSHGFGCESFPTDYFVTEEETREFEEVRGPVDWDRALVGLYKLISGDATDIETDQLVMNALHNLSQCGGVFDGIEMPQLDTHKDQDPKRRDYCDDGYYSAELGENYDPNNITKEPFKVNRSGVGPAFNSRAYHALHCKESDHPFDFPAQAFGKQPPTQPFEVSRAHGVYSGQRVNRAKIALQAYRSDLSDAELHILAVDVLRCVRFSSPLKSATAIDENIYQQCHGELYPVLLSDPNERCFCLYYWEKLVRVVVPNARLGDALCLALCSGITH